MSIEGVKCSTIHVIARYCRSNLAGGGRVDQTLADVLFHVGKWADRRKRLAFAKLQRHPAMKLAILIPLLSTISALPSIPQLQTPSNVSLGSDLPDPQFNFAQEFQAPLLPVGPTLMNVLHFMGIISIQDFNEDLGPRTYRAPGYPQVQITTYAWTQAKFLLWGIYNAINDMITFARFHNTNITLYWMGDFVGQISISVKPKIGLLDTTGNHTTMTGNGSALLSDNSSALIPAIDDSTNSTSDDFLISWDTPPGNSLAFPANSSTASSVSLPDMSIDLHRIAGGRAINRNDVFRSFFTALLHVAKYRPTDALVDFESKFTKGNVWIDMYANGAGCLVIKVSR